MPAPGVSSAPEANGWWTEQRVSEVWSAEAGLCTGPAPTPPPGVTAAPTMAPTPAPTLSAFDKLLEEGVEQDLDALGDQAADLGFDLDAVLEGGPLFANNAEEEEEEEFTGPDFLADLLVGFDEVQQEPTPAPTPEPTSLADLVDLGDLFGDFEEEEEEEPEEEEEEVDTTPPVCSFRNPADAEMSIFMLSTFNDPGVLCTAGNVQLPDVTVKYLKRDKSGQFVSVTAIKSNKEHEYRIRYTTEVMRQGLVLESQPIERKVGWQPLLRVLDIWVLISAWIV